MKGHLLALIAIIIWSLTYIQTKVLLVYLDPIEMLMVRFSLAWMVLWGLCPKWIPLRVRDEGWFVLERASGIFGYCVLENFALIHTTAINVGLLVTLAPLLTMLIVSAVHHFTYHYLAVTRKSIFYGLVLLWLFSGFVYSGSFHADVYTRLTVLGNLATLTLFASVGVFILWWRAVILISSTKTSNYIYLVPLINTTASVLVLHEPLGWRIILSSLMIIGGMAITMNNHEVFHVH